MTKKSVKVNVTLSIIYVLKKNHNCNNFVNNVTEKKFRRYIVDFKTEISCTFTDEI